jgi:hypothetical protein
MSSCRSLEVWATAIFLLHRWRTSRREITKGVSDGDPVPIRKEHKIDISQATCYHGPHSHPKLYHMAVAALIRQRGQHGRRYGSDRLATSPSGKAEVCKTSIAGSNPAVASPELYRRAESTSTFGPFLFGSFGAGVPRDAAAEQPPIGRRFFHAAMCTRQGCPTNEVLRRPDAHSASLPAIVLRTRLI